MTLPGSIQDREYQKFREAADGLPAVAMIIEQDESTTFLQSLGFAGSVGVVDNANGGTGALELLGKTFDKDILFDGATYSSTLGDFYLERINTAGTITWNIHESTATEDATPTANTESVFNLSALGTFTADQVLGLADLSITKIVSESWEDVSQGEVNILAPVWQKAKMVGMEPAIAESVVNRGGNLALIESFEDGRLSALGVVEAVANTTASEVNQELISLTTDAVNAGTTSPFLSISPSTQYAYSLVQDTLLGLFGRVCYYNADKTFLGTSDESAASGDFTTHANASFLRFDIRSAAAAVFQVSSVQLNQGATANTYATPLNAPFILGNRTAHFGGTYDDTDEVAFTNRFDTQVFTLAHDSSGTFITGATVETAVEIANGETKIWTGLGAGVTEFMVLAGERTQAEVRDLGFQNFDPIAPLTCQANDGLSTVVDRIYGSGSEIYFLHNVQTNAGYAGYGSPEINATDILGAEGAFGVDAVDATAFNIAYDEIQSSATNVTLSVLTNVLSYAKADSVAKVIRLAGAVTSLVIGNKYTLKNVNATVLTGTDVPLLSGAAAYAGSYTSILSGLNNYTFIATAVDLFIVMRSADTVLELDQSSQTMELVAHNIQENLAPNIENITAFGISGSLVQPMTEGQNHFVSAAGVGVGIEYSTSIVDLNISVRALALTKLDRTEQRLTYELKVVSTGGAAANSNTWVPFSDIAAMPDLVSAIKTLEEVLDTNIDSVDYYDNGAVINADATGTGAGDTLVQALVISGEPLIIHTIA